MENNEKLPEKAPAEKLSLEPYPYTRDFYPTDQRAWDHVANHMRAVAENFGYEHYNAPMLESFELYAAKSGDELVNEQSFVFTDRGDRRVVIRPELTPSLARMVARQFGQLAFSSPAVITMMCMFVLGGALKETGVADFMGNTLGRFCGKRQSSVIASVMVVGATFSAFMNNVAAVALLMPAVLHLSTITKVPPSRLLMPLAFGVILGGMCTLIASPPNMIVADIMATRGLVPFHFLDFSLFGISALLVGVLCVAYYGYRFLPNPDPHANGHREPQTMLAEVYRLNERLYRFRVPRSSILIGKTLGSTPLAAEYGARVIAIIRNGKKQFMPHALDLLQAEDHLIVAGRIEDLKKLGTDTLTLEAENIRPDLETDTVGVVEVVLPPRSTLVGKTLAEVHFFKRYGFHVLAIWRDGRPIRARLGDLTLRVGDALLLHGLHTHLPVLSSEEDFAIIRAQTGIVRKTSRAPFAIAAFFLMVLLSVTRVQPIEVSALLSALLVVASGAITMELAYKSIDWRSVALVAALLPIGLAAEHAGLISLLASHLTDFASLAPPLLVLMVFGIIASFVTQALDGSISVALLAPIVIRICADGHMSPYPFLMMTALSASNAFLLPISAKVNLLVSQPGGYRPIDFLRVGLPLSILVLITLTLIIPVFLPF